jgi:hypothetical protein
MANLAELEAALVNADRAGDAQAASMLASEVRRMRSQLKNADDLKAIATKRGEVSNPIDGMSGISKFLAGIGKSGYDTARGLGQLVGAVSQDDVKASRERDAALMDTGAGLTGNIVGTIGQTLIPGGLLKGAGVVANAAKAPQAAQALSTLGGAALVPKTIGGALGLGAGMGFVQPATSIGERAANTGVGAVATAAFPVGSRIYSGARAAVEPFYDAGQQRILGNALRRAAGDNADDVMRNMRSAQELVPGSAPTAGQAANNAGIAALERTATAIDPTVTSAYQSRMAAQNAARVGALEELSGTGGQRALFAADRGTAANQLYNAAYAAGVDLRRDAATGQFLPKAQRAGRQGEITKLMQTPAMQEAAERAMNLMKNDSNLKGKVLNPAGSVEGLDYTRRALSDMIGNTQGNEQRILMGLRDRLDTTLNTISPKYAEARATFAEMSKPINQMDIAAEISKRSIRPLDSQLMPNAYARSLTDDVAQSATGFGKATLEGTMSPEQMSVLNAIKSDLQRAEFAKNAGRGVGSDSVQKLAYSNILEGAGIPTWLQAFGPAQIGGNLMSRGADAVYGRANRELTSRLANGLLDPQEAARFMEMAAQARNPNMIANTLRGLLTPAGMSAPGLLNAQQQ